MKLLSFVNVFFIFVIEILRTCVYFYYLYNVWVILQLVEILSFVIVVIVERQDGLNTRAEYFFDLKQQFGVVVNWYFFIQRIVFIYLLYVYYQLFRRGYGDYVRAFESRVLFVWGLLFGRYSFYYYLGCKVGSVGCQEILLIRFVGTERRRGLFLQGIFWNLWYFSLSIRFG